MNIFISWSGEESKEFAEAINQWLPNVIQSLEPFYSPEDIKAGARWSTEIAEKLLSTRIGIICLTPDNLNAPWLMFEAGALSKQPEARVCPLLFKLKPIDVQSPLTQFQLNKFSDEGMRNILFSINDQLKPNDLAIEKLMTAFEKWWPELDAAVSRILSRNSSSPTVKSTRTERDLIEEILIRIRNSTVEHPISTDMIEMLLHCYGRLADAARHIADDKIRDSAANALYHLQFPSQHFITRVSDTSKRRELAEAYADAVTVLYQGSGDIDKDKLIRNLMHPSHGLIVPAPVIPKTSQQ